MATLGMILSLIMGGHRGSAVPGLLGRLSRLQTRIAPVPTVRATREERRHDLQRVRVRLPRDRQHSGQLTGGREGRCEERSDRSCSHLRCSARATRTLPPRDAARFGSTAATCPFWSLAAASRARPPGKRSVSSFPATAAEGRPSRSRRRRWFCADSHGRELIRGGVAHCPQQTDPRTAPRTQPRTEAQTRSANGRRPADNSGRARARSARSCRPDAAGARLHPRDPDPARLRCRRRPMGSLPSPASTPGRLARSPESQRVQRPARHRTPVRDGSTPRHLHRHRL